MVGPPTFTAIADTSSMAHFFTVLAPLTNKCVMDTPISIHNLNDAIMISTHVANLDIPALPPEAQHVHIVPALASNSLISIGQLCNAGCTVSLVITHPKPTYGIWTSPNMPNLLLLLSK